MAENEKDQRGSGNERDQENSVPRKESTKDSKPGSRTGGNTSNRGFASMNEEKHREISAMGGRASHESGRGHEFDSAEAREAGRKGGQASHASRNNNASTSGNDTEGRSQNMKGSGSEGQDSRSDEKRQSAPRKGESDTKS